MTSFLVVLVGGGTSDDTVGFSIVEAESQNTARQLLSDHPHLHTPGGTIIVHKFLSTPGM